MDAILVLNAGSSSLKFAVFACADAGTLPSRIASGHVAQIGADLVFEVHAEAGMPSGRWRIASTHGLFDHGAAMTKVFGWLTASAGQFELVAVGHRVVHGGRKYSAPVRVDQAVLHDLDALVPLAPLHQPHNLRPIRIMLAASSKVPQVACFDTAFHSTQPNVARSFALPRELSEAGVRRYGFHGLSYEYIASRLPRVLGARATGKVIVAHLGNGASLCALVDGKSVASTMGFSALDGLMMGTRCGALDPGAVLYLIQELGMSVPDVSAMLYGRSGLLGVSGISADMQTLLASADARAAEAVDLFVYRVVCEIGALAAAMGGVDALVFTAGIGEHSAAIRQRVCAGCEWLGARLDPQANANASGSGLIHENLSALLLAVVPTDEELMIARHTAQATRPSNATPIELMVREQRHD